jgi:hypothetical protein
MCHHRLWLTADRRLPGSTRCSPSASPNGLKTGSSVAPTSRALTNELPGRRTVSLSAPTQVAPRPREPAPTATASPSTESTNGSRHTRVIVGGIAAIVILISAVALVWRPWEIRQSNSAQMTSTTPLTFTTVPPLPPPAPPVSGTVQATPITPPTRDPQPGDPGYPTDPRFRYGVAGPHDSRFAYGVAPGEPCGNEPQQLGYTTEATNGAVATCLSPNGNGHGTWILVGSWGEFDGVHSHGSLCDAGGTAMSLDGRQMLCVTGGNASGTWEYGS